MTQCVVVRYLIKSRLINCYEPMTATTQRIILQLWVKMGMQMTRFLRYMGLMQSSNKCLILTNILQGKAKLLVILNPISKISKRMQWNCLRLVQELHYWIILLSRKFHQCQYHQEYSKMPNLDQEVIKNSLIMTVGYSEK